MLIEKIIIKNFGILHDAEIDLISLNKNVVFINGENGKGKTTLQSAIAWCIYGNEPLDTNKFFSNLALDKMEENSKEDVSASIQFSLEDGKSAIVERSQNFEKNRSGRPIKSGNSRLTVKILGASPARQTDILPNPEMWLNEKFPKRFENFFLFDGEAMRDFFSLSVKGAIEDAVKQIAGVDIFDDISRKFLAIETSTNRRISRLSGSKAEKINNELEIVKNNLAVSKVYSQQLKIEIASCEERERELDGLLKNFEGIEYKNKQVDEISNDIKDLDARVKRDKESLGKTLFKYGKIGFFSSALEEFDNVIKKATDQDRLPPPFKPDRLKKLILEGRCICGSNLHTDEDKVKEINSLIERFMLSSELGTILSETNNKLIENKNIVNSNIRHIHNYSNSIQESNSMLEAKRNARSNILDEIGNTDVVQISEWAKEKKSIIVKKEKYTRDDGALSVLINDLAKQERELDKKFKEASKGNKEAEQLRVVALKAEELSRAAGSIHASAIEQTRRKLQDSVSDKFSRVIGLDTARTEINSNFEVLTKRQKDGSEFVLSEGQSMMKAYIFSIALREIINLDFPLIVDTPLGRLSERPRTNLAEMLSELILTEYQDNDKQIIFLMTDSEYTPYTKKNFTKAKPTEFYLANLAGEEHVSTYIEKGIDPNWYKLTAWKDWHEGNIK